MADTLYPPVTYVADTGDHRGRGVFAGRGFDEGELVERVTVVPFDCPYDDLHEELKTRVFDWLALTGESEPTSVLALGFGSLYNHDNPANMIYRARPRAMLMEFVARRRIGADEELTINYNGTAGGAVSDTDDWFERTGVRRL